MNIFKTIFFSFSKLNGPTKEAFFFLNEFSLASFSLFVSSSQLDRYEQKVLKRENSITISYKTKVARMLFIIVGIFVLLHIPFTVLIFMRTKLLKRAVMNQLEGGFYVLSCISHYCLFLNAAINPIIYGLTNDNFRRAYHQTPIMPKHFTQFLHTLKQLKHKVCDSYSFYANQIEIM